MALTTSSVHRSLATQISSVAPTLGRVMRTPLSGMAFAFLRDRLLEGSDKGEHESAEAFLDALLEKTENLHKLKEADAAFATELQNLDIDLDRLGAAEPKPLPSGERAAHGPQLFLSVAFLSAYFVVLLGIFYAEISPDYNPGAAWDKSTQQWVEQGSSLIDLMHVLLGVLTAGVAQVLNYWFGGASRARKSA